jgi:hypothetical protein
MIACKVSTQADRPRSYSGSISRPFSFPRGSNGLRCRGGHEGHHLLELANDTRWGEPEYASGTVQVVSAEQRYRHGGALSVVEPGVRHPRRGIGHGRYWAGRAEPFAQHQNAQATPVNRRCQCGSDSTVAWMEESRSAARTHDRVHDNLGSGLAVFEDEHRNRQQRCGVVTAQLAAELHASASTVRPRQEPLLGRGSQHVGHQAPRHVRGIGNAEGLERLAHISAEWCPCLSPVGTRSAVAAAVAPHENPALGFVWATPSIHRYCACRNAVALTAGEASVDGAC